MATGSSRSAHAELYDELGVEPDATEDDIKRAFRRLSLTYHPDRRMDATEKREAASRWLKIASAYDVLSDERKRMVYDELGYSLLEDGLAILTPEMNTAAKLRKNFEKTQYRAREREHEARMRMNGSFVFAASAAQLIEPADPDTPIFNRALPCLTSSAISEDVSLQLDRKNSLDVGCQILTKSGLGGSTLRLGFKRILSHHSFVQLGASFDGSPLLLVATASRRISAHSSASMSTSLSARGVQAISLRSTRQLTKHTLGEMTWTVGGGDGGSLAFRIQRNVGLGREENAEGADEREQEDEARAHAAADADSGNDGQSEGRAGDESAQPGLRNESRVVDGRRGHTDLLKALLVPTRLARLVVRLSTHVLAALVGARRSARRRLSSVVADLALRPDGPKLGNTLVWRHSARSRSKLAVRCGAGGIRSFSVTLSVERLISLESRSGFGLALQVSNRGVMLKLRLERYAQRLLIPLYLAGTPTAPLIGLSAIVPALALAALRALAVAPRKRAQHDRDAAHRAAAAAAAEAALQAEWQAAMIEARLLSAEAQTRTQEELARNGLVVLEAYYGDVQEALRTVGSSAIERRSATQTFSDDEQHRWLDVRVPLQYAVVDSALSLPARSKYTLRGFARLAYHAPDAFGATTGGTSASGGVTGAADATTRVRCQLWIRYQLASNVYTICVNDDDPVKLGMM